MKITINNKLCYIDCNDSDLLKRIKLLLSYDVKGAFFSPAYRAGRWDGKNYLFSTTSKTINIGLLNRLLIWLDLEKIEYTIEDKRDIKENFKFEYLNDNRIMYVNEDGVEIKLRYFQKDAIRKYIEPKFGLKSTRGIFEMPPRSGKTLTVGTLGLVLNEYPIMFIVHTIDLAYQTKKVFEKLYNQKIGIVGDGNFDIDANIVITTIQSLCQIYDIKLKKTEDTFLVDEEKMILDENKVEFKNWVATVKTVMGDECHVSASDMWVEIPKYLKSVIYYIGCSGTPYREDNAELLIEQLWGNIVYSYSREQGVSDGFLLPIKVYMIILPQIDVSSSDYMTQKSEGLNKNPYIVSATEKLLKRHHKKNMSSVIIIKEKSQGNLIHKRIKCDYLHGKIKGNERARVYNELHNKNIMNIISTVTDIGVDIPSLDSVIIASPSKSKTSAFQRIRSGTPYADKKYGYVFILCPQIKTKDKNYLEEHWKKLKNILKKEKSFTVEEVMYEDL